MTTTSYAVYCTFTNQPPATNACRYATEEEARSAGNELLSRWMQPTGFEVRPTTDPVNYTFDHAAGRSCPLPQPQEP